MHCFGIETVLRQVVPVIYLSWTLSHSDYLCRREIFEDVPSCVAPEQCQGIKDSRDIAVFRYVGLICLS